ncbi:hypothetical protein [Pasteuria penetrans]|uniref:hypothetical protein n=1 Tax=Pasteuria penetrans TaxID=86005 RepID=UPI0011EC6137|nr:hypothetical protein [Pasteuria penetrans]
MITMAFSAWEQKSFTALTLGIVGWWGSLHWQILRERHWCAGEIKEEVDIRSFTGMSIAFLSLYVIPIYLYIHWYYISYNGFLVIIAAVYSFRIFPTFAHFLLGKRPFLLKSFANREGSSELSITSIFYDDFGRMYLVTDLRKKSEAWFHKYKFFIISFFCIIIITFIISIINY